MNREVASYVNDQARIAQRKLVMQGWDEFRAEVRKVGTIPVSIYARVREVVECDPAVTRGEWCTVGGNPFDGYAFSVKRVRSNRWLVNIAGSMHEVRGGVSEIVNYVEDEVYA